MHYPMMAALMQRRMLPAKFGGASAAAILLGSETDGLAFSADDQSMVIRDTATPANNYNSSGIVNSSGTLIGIDGKLTYSAPSAKLCLQRDGTYKYNAHNLYVNSAAPANQSITVVTSVPYEITITGSVSVTASGAATGTWTAGTTSFTAATTTLTLGSTSGSGTVHVRRANSNPDYIATAGTASYAIPYEYDASGNMLGIRVEEARTNVALYSRDLTNAAWTKTNITAAKDQTGIDGVANSASSLTATAGNGTCLQAITLASSARYQSAFVKRITGSGTINMTMDNGTTWTAITVTSDWTPLQIPTQTLANPTVGFRIVTSGDAIAVDCVQNENGAFRTSPIITYGTSLTRALDNISIATGSIPSLTSALSLYAKFRVLTGGTPANFVIISTGDTLNDRYQISGNGSAVVVNANVVTAQSTFTGVAGVEHKAATSLATNDFASTLDGAAVQVDTSCSIPTTTAVRFGHVRTPPNAVMCGHILEAIVLPRAWSDAELVTVTT